MKTVRFRPTTSICLFGLALVCLQTPAWADGSWSDGLYVGGSVGMVKGGEDTASGTSGGKVDFDNGAEVSVFVGKPVYGNLRGEAEVAYRSVGLSSIASTSASGDAKAASLMGNVIYDIDADLPIKPYIGAGAGLARLDLDDTSPFGSSSIDGKDTVGAFQAMAGASYALQDNIDVFAGYRYFATADGDFSTAAGTATNLGLKTHSVLAGVRFSFGASGSAMQSDTDGINSAASGNHADTGENVAETSSSTSDAPAPIAEQAALPSHTLPDIYMVHFKLNSAEVLPEAISIIEDVASNARAQDLTRLILSGHTDTSGPESYNEELSRKRAESVRTAFIALGFKEEEVTIKALGETQLLVPTGDNVFEPKNRRVEIVVAQ